MLGLQRGMAVLKWKQVVSGTKSLNTCSNNAIRALEPAWRDRGWSTNSRCSARDKKQDFHSSKKREPQADAQRLGLVTSAPWQCLTAEGDYPTKVETTAGKASGKSSAHLWCTYFRTRTTQTCNDAQIQGNAHFICKYCTPRGSH